MDHDFRLVHLIQNTLVNNPTPVDTNQNRHEVAFLNTSSIFKQLGLSGGLPPRRLDLCLWSSAFLMPFVIFQRSHIIYHCIFSIYDFSCVFNIWRAICLMSHFIFTIYIFHVPFHMSYNPVLIYRVSCHMYRFECLSSHSSRHIVHFTFRVSHLPFYVYHVSVFMLNL